MTKVRMKIYNALVNRKPEIRKRYLKIHERFHGKLSVIAWLYLFWINFLYYAFHIGIEPVSQGQFFENKKLPVDRSESCEAQELIGTEFGKLNIDKYDVFSFDMFDTLVFRPFSEPTDLFYYIGEQLGILDFCRIRQDKEQQARKKCFQKFGHYEVTLQEIWEEIENDLGISAAEGMRIEQELEYEYCFANPYFLKLFHELVEKKKKIIITTDMYLPTDLIKKILIKNGFSGFEKIYLSCENGMSKSDGSVFEELRQYYSAQRLVHIGDNEHSDYEMPQKYGIKAFLYPNINRTGKKYRSEDMSAVVGSAYRGVVNSHIRNGVEAYSMDYEYGFIYGGLFVLGYCSFIHEYCAAHHIDKVLFLSRDGDILQQVYRILFPEDVCEYVYWSRKVSLITMYSHNKEDYYRRFLEHKANQDIKISNILKSMKLDFLQEVIEHDDAVGFRLDEALTGLNLAAVKMYLESKDSEIKEHYSGYVSAAGKYYRNVLDGVESALLVDIGWAGSGAAAIMYLAGHVWNIDCRLTGVLAGTNTVYNTEPNATEAFLQSGKMISYMYSQSHNRDLLKKHDLNRDYNVFWELLLSSPTPQFSGFAEGRTNGEYCENLNISLEFGESDANQKGILSIQSGIKDFIELYTQHFHLFPYMYRISGRDAYAPMLTAAGFHEKYLKEVKNRFDLRINVE